MFERDGRELGDQTLLEAAQSDPAPARETGTPYGSAPNELLRLRSPVRQEPPVVDRPSPPLPLAADVERAPQQGNAGDEARKGLLRRHPTVVAFRLLCLLLLAGAGYLYWDNARHFDTAFVQIDSAILSGTSPLVGWLVGGVSTLAASWLTQRGQLRAQTLVREAVKREALYAEFIIEASKRLTEAWNHQAESPEVFAGLYFAVSRMRLSSSDEVIRIAQLVAVLMVEAYAAPAKSSDEFRERARSEDNGDPLKEFSDACRIELRSLRS